MNLIKEKLPSFVLENEDVLKIRDLRILGIYTFVKMMVNDGEHTVARIIDKIKEQFLIDEKMALDMFKIIIDLLLITMSKEK